MSHLPHVVVLNGWRLFPSDIREKEVIFLGGSHSNVGGGVWVQSEKGQLKRPLMRFKLEGHMTLCLPSVFIRSGLRSQNL